MRLVFSKEGFTALRASWVLLGLSVLAAAAIGAGGQWVNERDKLEGGQAEKRLREARSRVEGARRERDNLTESAEVFRSLVDRGILQDERRLDLIELVAELRLRHNLTSLDYEIAPQRTLPGPTFASVDVLSSRVKMKVRALHEGDVLAFVEELSRSARGLYPVDRCAMRRSDEGSALALRARVEADCSLEWISLKEKQRAPRAG
jgi:hypothetical protein